MLQAPRQARIVGVLVAVVKLLALTVAMGDLIWVGLEASGAHADVRRLSEAGRDETARVLRRFTETLAARGALRPGLSAAIAADALHVLVSPHTFHVLRRVLGWSAEQYRRWLHEIAKQQLLRARVSG